MEIINGTLTNDVARSKYTRFWVRANFWVSSLSPILNDYIKVECIRAYSFNEAIERVKPTIIICNIEGGETALFKNANLDGVEKVLLELHQWAVGRKNIKKLFDYFSARDFHYNQWHSSGSVVLFSHIYRDKMRKERLELSEKEWGMFKK